MVLPSCEPKLGKEEGRYHVSNKLGIQRASEWWCCLLQALGQPTWVRAWVLGEVLGEACGNTGDYPTSNGTEQNQAFIDIQFQFHQLLKVVPQ